MTRRTRKLIVWIIAILIILGMSLTVHRTVQYDKGQSTNYALDKKTQAKKNGILVFCYHRIINDDLGVNVVKALSDNSQLHDFAVTSTQFKKQMKFLKDHKIRVISGQQMYEMVNNHTPIKGKYAVLTFDDIDRSTIENAMPVMEKYKFPFTTFIVTGNTGRYREGSKFATWKNILAAKKKAGNLQSLELHTNDMHYLTKRLVPIIEKPDEYNRFTRDFITSQRIMHSKTGQFGTAFAYPYGGGTTKTTNFLNSQNLQWVATLNTGVVNDNTNLMYTPRMIINNDSWPSIHKWFSTK
ncbi:polysaccharide deacetylase family protein [Nicoliella spurrieriana]|uniref:Polysaccharide deacetylase family protein n=1 Tax=Nicoliella spurrieriana TaxID=2925830 RepID=A0A976RSR9_9LACO|nr:polysaccharide deacetylase family protein [Nicoliella spurrieriana]UQS87086.1 polysaccharide deacetylase family protein [Nicoliella spurrieriana]